MFLLITNMEYIAVKQLAKRVISPVLNQCGLYDYVLNRHLFGTRKWLILMYHRVINDVGADPFKLGMCVHKERFEAQIRFVRKHFTPIRVCDAVRILTRGGELPRNPASITFDDGYEDFCSEARPILAKYDCPTSIYITTGGLETQRSFWWDRVIDCICRARRKTIPESILPGLQEVAVLSLAPGRRRATALAVLEWLWDRGESEIEDTIVELRQALGVPDEGALIPGRMSPNDIRSFDPGEVEVGAHSVSHTALTTMGPLGTLDELAGSREVLETITGRAVTGFAYPGGRQNAAVADLVKLAGFEYGAGTVRGLNQYSLKRFNLCRIGMPDTPVSDLKRSLASLALRTREAESPQEAQGTCSAI